MAVTVAVGLALYIHHHFIAKNDDSEPVVEPERPEGCCGQHEVCEKESLLVGLDKNIVYYEDEELDTYIGKLPQEYSDEEIEQFRDVLYTLRPDDVAGWVRSLQMRKIALPEPVYDEMLGLLGDYRTNKI